MTNVCIDENSEVDYLPDVGVVGNYYPRKRKLLETIELEVGI